MPVESIKVQKGINRYRNADPQEPYLLKNCRILPFGVVVGLRAPTNFYPFWDPDNYTLSKGVIETNRSPYWSLDGATDNTVEVLKIASGSESNRAPYWTLDGTTDNVIVVNVIAAGSVTVYEPYFNLEDGETINIELT